MSLQFEKVGIDFAVYPMDTSRGAPMGRASGVWTRPIDGRGRFEMVPYYDDLPFKLHLQKVDLIDGVYDRGGAYWGSPSDLYVAYCHAWISGIDREFELRYFVRAGSREDAKKLVLLEYPNAKFYR